MKSAVFIYCNLQASLSIFPSFLQKHIKNQILEEFESAVGVVPFRALISLTGGIPHRLVATQAFVPHAGKLRMVMLIIVVDMDV